MNSPTAWALVFHILGFVFWMAGLLVVTQVLATHTQEGSAEVRQVLTRLESKLLNGVALPGACITVLAGIIVLALQPAYLHQSWLHAKLSLVAILIAVHFVVVLRAKRFQAGRIELRRSECKILHGVTSLLFLGILVLVMIKPF